MLYTFDDPTGKWVFVCACGTALSHVLCSKVEAFMDEHYGQPATAPVTVGMMTVEV
jgi:galactitol-specific phosphotransferase system IIB component